MINQRAMAFAGTVLVLVLIGGWVVELARGNDGSPYSEVFAGGVINVHDCCYHRRVHSQSMTHAPDTGHRSPARRALRTELQARARSNVARVLAGEPADLSPVLTGRPARLTHVLGPRLRWDNA